MHLYNAIQCFSSDVYGNTVSELWNPWSTEHNVIHSVNLFFEKGSWPIFVPFVSSSFFYSLYTLDFSFSPQPHSVIDQIPLYVQSDMPIAQVLLNSTEIQGFKFTLPLISFNPSSHSSLCLSLDPNLISEHLVQGNSSCQQGQSSLQTPTQVAFCWNWYCF